MPTLRAQAQSVDIVIGSTSPAEGRVRATAVVLDADVRVCIVSCDLLCLPVDVCDRAARSISEATGIPFSNIMISCTHTHHVPMTVRVHGAVPDPELMQSVERAIVESATGASRYLDEGHAPNDVDVDFLYGVGSEATVGRNSRFLLRDGTIAWHGYDPDEIVRPTGPFDPSLPVIALRRPSGALVATIFSHANHNIGSLGAGCSPGFYGLTAQSAEERHGGSFVFLPGALGSTHPDDAMPVPERLLRVGAALDSTLSGLRQGIRGPVSCLKEEFVYRIRSFDEDAEDAAASEWCRRWFDPESAEWWIRTFREMRAELAPHQGEERRTWIQTIRLGDVCIVGIPGELFGVLGAELKERSPFRRTIVTSIANDWIGYIPDREAMRMGGYQTWTGGHSLVEVGTGERMVDACVELLERSMADAPAAPLHVRELASDDALRLQTFYNTLDAGGRTLFRPMGWSTAYSDCRDVVSEVEAGRRFDAVVDAGGRIAGWAFVSGLDGEYPVFGIGLSEECRGRGLGRELMGTVIARAKELGRKGVDLTVVQSNARAKALYESFGFRETGTLECADGLSYYSMRLEF